MVDIEIIKMAFTWVAFYLALLFQNLGDGYAYKSIWLFGLIPLILRFMNGSGYLHVKWMFLLAVIIMAGMLTFAFSLTNPDLKMGLKDYGKEKKSSVKFTALFMGFFLFSLLFLGNFWRDGPFADTRVVTANNMMGGNNNISLNE